VSYFLKILFIKLENFLSVTCSPNILPNERKDSFYNPSVFFIGPFTNTNWNRSTLPMVPTAAFGDGISTKMYSLLESDYDY
jgi:hypothetical protein